MISTTLVIEHCEPAISDWLLLEYKHASKIWASKTIFTGVAQKKDITLLKQFGVVEQKALKDLFDKSNCIVLDPSAKEPLTTSDFTRLQAIVVGGILGYEKLQGRTKTLISDKYDFETRHLGKIQLSVDGAVFIAKAISMGMNLSEIEITNEVEIVHDQCHSTILPFGYPIINNNPIITPGLIEYLSEK